MAAPKKDDDCHTLLRGPSIFVVVEILEPGSHFCPKPTEFTRCTALIFYSSNVAVDVSAGFLLYFQVAMLKIQPLEEWKFLYTKSSNLRIWQIKRHAFWNSLKSVGPRNHLNCASTWHVGCFWWLLEVTETQDLTWKSDIFQVAMDERKVIHVQKAQRLGYNTKARR